MLIQRSKLLVKPFCKFNIPANWRAGQSVDFLDQTGREKAPALFLMISQSLLEGETI